MSQCRAGQRSFVPRLTCLEDRTVPSTFTVLNNFADGPGSLAQAIFDANNNFGPDTIDFNIPGAGVQTIAPPFALPQIYDTVTIDGTSQPGFAGQPLIELNGAGAGDFADGLDIFAANCLVKGLIINGFSGFGIDIFGFGATGNMIQGNYIGTDATGTSAVSNFADGIRIDEGASSNLIGGSSVADRNVISGNSQNGIFIHGFSTYYNMVAGNYIGTNADGTASVANARRGVQVGSGFNIIGTNADGIGDATEGNVISGNGGSGLLIYGDGSDYNVVAGNLIGTTADGESALENVHSFTLGSGALGADVFINGGPQFNQIGTSGTHGAATDILERNVLGGGNRPTFGVLILDASNNSVAGNYIGTDATGTNLLGNAYSGVQIITFDQYAQNNRIGVNASDPDAAHEANLIAGNGFAGLASDLATYGTLFPGYYDGVSVISGGTEFGGFLPSYGNIIAGNLIGTDANGNFASGFGNADAGVYLNGAGATLIGTNADGVGDDLEVNVISGNAMSGITIDGSLPTDTTTVAGNYIGTNTGPGVQIINDSAQNTIGGLLAAAGNTIAFNTGPGVLVLGSGSITNAIRSNSIYQNGALGIDLGGDGVTPNHTGAAVGPNNFQNFPVLLDAAPGSHTQVVGKLTGLPNTTYTLDFFASASADPSGYGQGQRYLGSGQVTTNGSGKITFNTKALGILLGASLEGEVITATATDAYGNTSEFSAAIEADNSQGENSQRNSQGKNSQDARLQAATATLLIGTGVRRQAMVPGMATGAIPMSAAVDQVFAETRTSMASIWLGAHTVPVSAPHASQDSAAPHAFQARLDDLARHMALDLAEILAA
jgi:hypothetical protein